MITMTGFDLLMGFISTLLATLTGVIVGFWNDRKIEQIRQYDRTIQHLQAIEKELTRNRETINHTIDVISRLQDNEGGETSHYAVDLLSTDAWGAALNEGIIDSLDMKLYKNLNEVYYRAGAINELIKRLRTESIHPLLGEVQEEGIFETEVWTITVTYWDEDEGRIKEAELATVLKEKENSLGIRIDGVTEDIKESISDLERKRESAENKTLKRITKRLHPFDKQ